MKPSAKSKQMEDFLEQTSGRTTAIHGNRCLPEPFGCGGTATEFRNGLSMHEYRITGLCQQCQDSIFGWDDEVD